MKCLLPFLLLLPLLAAGCATSEGYRRAVNRTYPVIADRLGKYELTDEEKFSADRLREVSTDRKAVTYEDARPAWESAAPAYRQHVAGDDALPAQRRADWMKTADGIDRLQAAEEKYRSTLGIVSPPQ